MSGYKRVNFYELCRLCATNQQKDKTHIFHEEGRKIQLQMKIQNCLSLTVCENDFLPKVVCSKCLRSLEVCNLFRQECVASESMLSSYFKNFRYTEDFKKSGKVYIKDTSSKAAQFSENELNHHHQSHIDRDQKPSIAAAQSTTIDAPLPFYTVQLPTTSTVVKTETTEVVQQNQIAYNLNTINLQSVKQTTAIPKAAHELNNVVVNANGEVINIAAQLVDFEMIINHANLQKKNNANNKINNISTNHIKKEVLGERQIVKIDLTDKEDVDTGQRPKIENVCGGQRSRRKPIHQIRVEEPQQQQQQPKTTVVFTNSNEFNHTAAGYINYCPQANNNNNSNIYGEAPPPANQSIGQTNHLIENPQRQSTVNLNVLNTALNNQIGNNVADNNGTRSINTTNISRNNNSGSNSKSANEPLMSTNNGVKTHCCDVCQKCFKRREHLYQHVKLHTGFRPFVCENCNKSFMRKEHLLRHMTSHSGQKNFTCNICDKSFSRNDNLLKHRKTHEKATSYTCEICQKHFVMKHYYLAHKLTHDNNSDRCSGGSSTNINNVWNVLKT